MTEQPPKKAPAADWLMRGVLTKLGDTFDRFTGRRWVPSSSLAASELIERIKKLLDAEAKEVSGKGLVVPHNIKLKMQWDKFSDDSEEAINALKVELLTAAADHINDSLYYTFAPVSLEIKRDYFIEGVKLYVSFDKFSDEDNDVEQNVTILGKSAGVSSSASKIAAVLTDEVQRFPSHIARFEIDGNKMEKRLDFPAGKRLGIGRTAESDLTLDDASVSKYHASLVADENGILSLADTGSTNGTFVNGERIAYGKAMRLADGDRVKFGRVETTFEHVTSPFDEAPATAPEESD